jgi:hypothetical protein
MAKKDRLVKKASFSEGEDKLYPYQTGSQPSEIATAKFCPVTLK